jgi:hypothetical protein
MTTSRGSAILAPLDVSPDTPEGNWDRSHSDAGQFTSVNKALQALHQIGAVISPGEYRPGENASGPLGAGAGEQLLPHNS